MPTFKYRVRDKSGKAIAGTIDAATLQTAGDHLFQLGYFPITIKEEREAVSSALSHILKRFQKVKLEDLIFFSLQFSTFYKAGLPLLTGLKSILEEINHKELKRVLEEICRKIEEGSTLNGAMAGYPDVFPEIYINMVRAGEDSGTLGESLDRFITLADRELRTRKRLKEVTRYPKIVILAVLIAFAVLITFVIPRFADIFSSFDTALPLPTRVMIGINELFQSYWYLILGVTLGIPILIGRYIRTEKGRYNWDNLKTRIPVFGPIFLKIALSRFAYVFAMLSRSGIPIRQTLEITSSTIENVALSQSIKKISDEIIEGKSLAEAMKNSERFTPLVLQMTSVGESTGTLNEMLIKVTEYYDLQVEDALKKLPAYIEPILIVFLGVSVLFLALAVFLPWWNLASIFK